jgi:hypothetical protein
MKLLVIEEIELFHKDGFNLIVPENSIIEGRFNGDVWELEYNGIEYWQYNYSIEDSICPVNEETIYEKEVK